MTKVKTMTVEEYIEYMGDEAKQLGYTIESLYNVFVYNSNTESFQLQGRPIKGNIRHREKINITKGGLWAVWRIMG